MDLESPGRRRRGKELEDAILGAAWQVLQASGYSGFTIDAVADRAGTSRPVLYRRWSDRAALLRATIIFGLEQTRPAVPDTGSLREDTIEIMRRTNTARAALIPLVSVLIGSHFGDSGVSFADLRAEMLQTRPGSAIEVILDRAVARGEVDAARLTPRVRSVAFDLFRHDLLVTLKPLTDADMIAIVDEIFLPLVAPRASPTLDQIQHRQ